MPNTSYGRLPMKVSILRSVIVTIGILIVVTCTYINYINLVEAFGSGPPYFDRTTNMDKWSNPIPFLVLLDIAVIIILGGLIWFFAKIWKKVA